MKKLTFSAGFLFATLLTACVNTDSAVQDITAPLSGARIKFFNFSIGSPGVNFYANDMKMTAISSATGVESTTGITYTGVGSGGLYTAIAPGQYTLSGRIAAATDKDLVIASAPATLADGKAYSYFMTDVYNTTTKKSDSFVVEDPIPAITYTVANVRFVNAVYNSSPMILYAKNTVSGVETAIGGATAYKTATAFVPVPGAAYNLALRTAGSSTDLVTRTNVSFSEGRAYTIAVRGDMVTTVTANRPFLDNTANY
jgi:hypothetical protein